jgi:hypothetical protein
MAFPIFLFFGTRKNNSFYLLFASSQMLKSPNVGYVIHSLTFIRTIAIPNTLIYPSKFHSPICRPFPDFDHFVSPPPSFVTPKNPFIHSSETFSIQLTLCTQGKRKKERKKERLTTFLGSSPIGGKGDRKCGGHSKGESP